MKKQAKKIAYYILISIGILIIEAFIIGCITEAFPDTIKIFGVPFAFSFFIIGMTLIFLYMLFLLLFPRTNKRRSL